MGLYQYIREQNHRSDLVGELGRWMTDNYGKRPDHSSLAFRIAAEEFESCGNWTRQEAITRTNQNKELQQILEIVPRLRRIIERVQQLRIAPGYNQSQAYSDFKAEASEFVGWEAENSELCDSDSYEVVIDAIVSLLPPDESDLYPDGLPDDIELDI
jgi:hypothetical protein